MARTDGTRGLPVATTEQQLEWLGREAEAERARDRLPHGGCDGERLLMLLSIAESLKLARARRAAMVKMAGRLVPLPQEAGAALNDLDARCIREALQIFERTP